MSEATWKLWGDVAFYGVATASTVFVLLYATLSPWWRSATGRNIMAVMGSLALASVYFAFAVALGRAPFHLHAARFVLFGSLFLAITWRVIIFIREQLCARRLVRETDSDSRT
jgi:hypothetical protein